MSSKTRKNRKLNQKYYPKNWKKSINETRFQIIGKEPPLGTNGKFLRIQILKVPKNPENPEIRRKLTRNIDYWKNEDKIKFKYLSNKYGWPRNQSNGYSLTPEDEENINKLLDKKKIREDVDTPTPKEEKKEEEKINTSVQPEIKAEPEPEPEPERTEPEPEPEPEPQPELLKKNQRLMTMI